MDSDHWLIVLSLRHKLLLKVVKRPRNLFDAQLCKEEGQRIGYMEAVRAKFKTAGKRRGEMGGAERSSDYVC